LEVKDNGRGMQPEMLQRFRETGAGMGVGLISMQERARELGGTLQIASDRTGTSLCVTVPLLFETGTSPQESTRCLNVK
jgi:signal transduction histidine kinase